MSFTINASEAVTSVSLAYFKVVWNDFYNSIRRAFRIQKATWEVMSLRINSVERQLKSISPFTKESPASSQEEIPEFESEEILQIKESLKGLEERIAGLHQEVENVINEYSNSDFEYEFAYAFF